MSYIDISELPEERAKVLRSALSKVKSDHDWRIPAVGWHIHPTEMIWPLPSIPEMSATKLEKIEFTSETVRIGALLLYNVIVARPNVIVEFRFWRRID